MGYSIGHGEIVRQKFLRQLLKGEVVECNCKPDEKHLKKSILIDLLSFIEVIEAIIRQFDSRKVRIPLEKVVNDIVLAKFENLFGEVTNNNHNIEILHFNFDAGYYNATFEDHKNGKTGISKYYRGARRLPEKKEMLNKLLLNILKKKYNNECAVVTDVNLKNVLQREGYFCDRK